MRGGAAGAAATPEAIGPGEELRVAVGDVVILPLGSSVRVRARNEGATILVFALVSQGGEGTPEP